MEIKRLLVANRGEIAARVFRTCDRLGIATVAVVAPDEPQAFHARRAGVVRSIAGYLHSEEHIRAAKAAGADAIHPGYGFLAESPDFAEAVEAAGLLWVGPPAEAMRLAADKLAARRLAEELGIPVVPSGPPEQIGFPLIVKAAAGGGGRGMRIVRTPEELEPALEAARREAEAAFGDDTVFCERLVERPRHVEVQLVDAVSWGERDCSIQRRHQKVLEESPAPALADPLREALSVAAARLAGAAGYRGAGTVEFMVSGEDFFFLELNARLQVEHPVTELVVGRDLVEEQLRVAVGEAVHRPPPPEGHAVEVRLYAEDPLTFLPQAGTIDRLEFPDGIRVDPGVDAGDEVPVAYDPLIAKLIAHGETRDEAFRRLSHALRQTRVGGIPTNLAFLRWLTGHPEVRAGRATTAFLTENPPLSTPVRVPAPWRGGWRLNAEPAPEAPPPRVESAVHEAGTGQSESAVTAPMPGTVIRVLAGEGDRVEPRQPLVVLEAMKMETPLVSPFDAVVRRVHVAEGDRVAGGAVLVELDAGPARD